MGNTECGGFGGGYQSVQVLPHEGVEGE